MNVTYVYVIRPTQPDYGRIQFVLSSANSKNESKPFACGYEMETTNEEYAQKYKGIYEQGLNEAVVVRDHGLRKGAQPHITVLIPVKDSAGEVRAITEETERFAKENTGCQMPLSSIVKNKNEIRKLAMSVDRMEKQTLDYFHDLTAVTAEAERISAELDIAKQIQQSMLPAKFPNELGIKEVDIFATMEPAKEVGGDFYDFFMVDDTHIAMVVADVSGKGVPAALFMTIAKTLLKDRTLSGKDLGAVFMEGNRMQKRKKEKEC